MKIVTLFACLLLGMVCYAHIPPANLETKGISLIDSLNRITDESQKFALSDSLAHFLSKELLNIESHYYPFTELSQKMGRVQSPDKKVNVFTWNLALDNGTFKYYGVIQYRYKKDSIKTSILIDHSDSIVKPELVTSNKEDWFGALYYEISELKVKGRKYYMLLGADLNNWISKKKIIEPLYFDKHNEPVLGKPMIKHEGKLKNRIIFEYSAQSSMVLHYDKKVDKIVFHHLEPIKPNMKSRSPEFLGASLIFDALIIKGEYFKIQRNVKLRNKD